MRDLRSNQMTLQFNPVSRQTTEALEVMEELVTSLGKGVLVSIEASLSLRATKNPDTGRTGMSAEQVLRMALIKQMYSFTYRELQPRVEDSILLRRFAGYEFLYVPARSTLQENITALTPETWEEVNTALIKLARKRGLDKGEKVRIDTTAVETLIHHPTDSSLLWDGIRVLTRLLKQSRKQFPKIAFPFHDRTRASKKLFLTIANAKSKEKTEGAYRDLLKYAEEVLGYGKGAIAALHAAMKADRTLIAPGIVAGKLIRYVELLRRVIHQTKRRVLKGEKVPASEKIVSIFEDHTDIIEKGGRETEFGHKVCLTIGDSALILDCQILDGNPADAEIFTDALDSFQAKYHKTPKTVATDKGFGSSKNAEAARHRGVESLTFSRRQLPPEAQGLLASGPMEKMLIRFRAGAEAIISAAKRGVNLARCLWRGWDNFCAYVWSCIAAHNLRMMVAALR